MLAPPTCLKQGKEDKVCAVCHGAFQATKVEGSAADATSRVAFSDLKVYATFAEGKEKKWPGWAKTCQILGDAEISISTDKIGGYLSMKFGKHLWERDWWSAHVFLYLSEGKTELYADVTYFVTGFGGTRWLYVTVLGHKECAKMLLGMLGNWKQFLRSTFSLWQKAQPESLNTSRKTLRTLSCCLRVDQTSWYPP